MEQLTFTELYTSQKAFSTDQFILKCGHFFSLDHVLAYLTSKEKNLTVQTEAYLKT